MKQNTAAADIVDVGDSSELLIGPKESRLIKIHIWLQNKRHITSDRYNTMVTKLMKRRLQPTTSRGADEEGVSKGWQWMELQGACFRLVWN